MKFAARISIFGGRDIDEQTYAETVELGRLMARENWLVFCGGAEGVMEAIAKGVSEEGGVCIGILKGQDPGSGNMYLTIPIATALGVGRNALLAYNCDVAVAVSGQYGTLSEIAYALQLGKPVVGYKSWPVEGVVNAGSVNDIIKQVKSIL
ncbi:MAG: TIGR00725 family protein [FCB group bacterium]|nr:TIGR00725 family protein [FCB group bacterium]